MNSLVEQYKVCDTYKKIGIYRTLSNDLHGCSCAFEGIRFRMRSILRDLGIWNKLPTLTSFSKDDYIRFLTLKSLCSNLSSYFPKPSRKNCTPKGSSWNQMSSARREVCSDLLFPLNLTSNTTRLVKNAITAMESLKNLS